MKYPELPKFPVMTVSGVSVTENQARDIIVQLEEKIHFDEFKDFPVEISNKKRNLIEKIFNYKNKDFKDIAYLYTARIVSNTRGKFCGWCDWDGTIKDTYSIVGRWPKAEDIEEEWTIVAKAFPFLDLSCFIWDEHWNHNDNSRTFTPIIEFVVKNGNVSTQVFSSDKALYPQPTTEYYNDTSFEVETITQKKLFEILDYLKTK